MVPRTSGSQACGRVTLALHACLALLALEGACGRVAPPEGRYPYCWPGVPGVVGSSRAPGPAVVCPLGCAWPVVCVRSGVAQASPRGLG